MKTIIYRKSDLLCVGVVQENTTVNWEIEHNVIPNYHGTPEDYGYIETEYSRFHLENNNGEVIAIEDGLTIAEQKQNILKQLAELDKIITRADEQFKIDNNLICTYQPILDAIAQKQILRQQLQGLGV